MLIALVASLGIAVKPVVSSLARIITGPLMIPGGVLAGGIYMMFLVLAVGLSKGRFSATIAATVQAILVILTGIGSHGAFSVVTYIAPGIAVDLVIFLFSLGNKKEDKYGVTAIGCFFACMCANLMGTFLVGVSIFNIPFVPLMLSLCVSALSGGLGGLLAYALIKRVRELNIL
jgi:hypothetical protein